ncbi:S9 family peptidase [Weeksella virosa]|uniref:S9 family peptidase n=1 Tax=Weeksella virosa TaxID=1014 RepID=UPI002552379D|nr:S9 family peptidase [Weeksella virosa]MDK7375265.1 S9 family peptidase [Weeksella virosa]
MMKNILTIFCFISAGLYAYGQTITVDKIYTGRYSEKGLYNILPMQNGEDYTTLTSQGILKNAYTKVANNSTASYEITGKYDNYTYSKDERYILLQSNTKPIYRRSFTATFEVYDKQIKKKVKVFGGKPIQEPLLSPDNSKIAFVYENNLYYQNLDNLQTTQVTQDGEKNKIINGINDWVWEEEFGFVRNFDWNSDASALAFVRLDEQKVKEVSLPIYYNNLYPKEMRFKYPKAGEDNSLASLHVYHLADKKITTVDLSSVENYYLPKIKFTPQKDVLSVVSSNRHQNKVDISLYSLKDNKIQKLFTETDNAWIETDQLDLEFLPDNSFIWASERDGNRHYYWYNAKGKLINQITKGDWEVTDFYGFDEKSKTLYFQANAFNGKRTSTERQIYSIEMNGKNLKMLSKEVGTNSARFSADYRYFIQTFSSVNQPKIISLIETKSGKNLGTIIDNSSIKNVYATDNAGSKELFTLTAANGQDLNAYIIKPKDFDPTKKYPVLMYQYSGPGSQTIANTWHNANDQWHMLLAQKGYLVVAVDGRGTGFRGAKFKKQTYLQLGKYEVEDQIAAAQALAKLPYIDASRIGIWGWSYGGFMASNVLFKGNDTFRMAIAVAPVTNWRFYDTVYTERFMRTPQENTSGYDDNSPINHVDKFLKGNLLLVHGTADDNVHVQNTYELAEALTQANKQFSMHIYTDKNHGIYGGKTRIQLYDMMTNHILENL